MYQERYSIAFSFPQSSCPLRSLCIVEFIPLLFASLRVSVRFSASVGVCRFVIFRLFLSLLCFFAAVPTSVARGDILSGDEQPAKQPELWNRIAGADVIYIGENHGSRKDHLYELDLVRGMIRRRIQFTVGWEMFDRTQQPDLDRFNEGKLTLAELFARTRFDKSWATYSPLYARILATTTHANVPNIGLNAPTALAHKVAKGEPLSPSEKKQLPTEFRIPAGAYRHFVGLLGEHPGMELGDLPRFFAAQNVWDQTMAQTILEFHKRNPGTKLLVLTGRGHVQDGFGVPNYVHQKSAAKQLVLVP
jgi:uncharacterized iron-regulated protein